MQFPQTDTRPQVVSLLANLKAALPALETLLASAEDHWGAEDAIYRFYHQSFKVYGLQARTVAIVDALQALAPDRELNEWFRLIIDDGTGKKFAMEHNKNWLPETRPILEAFFHAHYFLRMAVQYAKTLDDSLARRFQRACRGLSHPGSASNTFSR